MSTISYTGSEISGAPSNKVAELEKVYNVSLAARRAREAEWKRNIFFLRGRQWEDVANTPRGTRSTHFAPPQSKVKLTSNMIYPLARQAASHLVDNISQPIATPSTSEPQDIFAASLATDLLVFRQYEDDEVEKRRLETLWTMCCGLNLRMTTWDADKSSLLAVSSEQGQRVEGAGEIDTISLNPWQFLISPWARNPNESDYLIIADVQTLDFINSTYNADVPAEATSTEDWLLEKDMMGMIADTHGSNASFQAPKKSAILKRIYIEPDRKHPKGQQIHWANGVLLMESELPEGEMPFRALTWFPAPGSPYPLAFITPLVDVQKERNIAISQLIELKNRSLRGDILVRGIAAPTQEEGPLSEYVDDQTGRKTVYLDNTAAEWEFIKYDLNPTVAEEMIALMFNDMMQSSGIHEGTLGKQQPAGTPATTTLALKESDLSGLTMFRAGFNLAHSKVARQKLIIAKNHYSVPRIIRIVGEHNAVNVSALMGADLGSTEDVRPTTEPMLTESEKNNIRAQLVAQGAYGPYMGPEDQLAKVRMILTSGLPESRDEAERQCAPMTLEELEQTVGKIYAGMAELKLKELEAMLNPPEQQPGNDPTAGMPPEMQMMMAMGQGQQPQQ